MAEDQEFVVMSGKDLTQFYSNRTKSQEYNAKAKLIV